MSTFAQIMALISALVHIGVAPLEMILFDRPAAQRFLKVEAGKLEDVRMWAFVVGARNLLAGLAVIAGLVILRSGHEVAGRAVVVTACFYMVFAGLAMGVADLLGYWRPRGGSVMGVFGSILFPIITLIAVLA